MKKSQRILKNAVVTVGILCASFLLCLLLQNSFGTEALIPAVFIFGIFLTAILTDGYVYGIISVPVSVLAVNYAFTFPYFILNFTLPENIVSAVIMMVIALTTSGLATKIKRQEGIKAESEKEKMRANLLRAVSHDLRTPLTAIYGSSSAMLENPDGFTEEQKRKMLQGIKEEAEWLGRMVENLLSVTKLDSGNVKIIKTPTVLEELIDSVLIKVNKRYPGQKIKVDLPEDFITIPMDAILIEQVIVNLLENAVQHAEGMTELFLKVSVNADRAVFEIQDNGCGIEEEKLKHIFALDGRTDSAPSDGKRANAGIGLSVCATIVKAHGGEIQAENRRGGGAVFRFTLDMEEARDE